MDESAGTSELPVLVLGSHRSGTSAVMGLLAEAGGLELGQVIPPTRANMKGYFESAGIVKGHNEILDGLDRDWTCPPMWLDVEDVTVDGLEFEIDRLQRSGQPWGVKDPRLLFMLPIWARLLPSMRLVGVIRDHEEVVRSLVARDGLDPGVADTITRAHERRLRLLRDACEFPVIDFSAPPNEVRDHVRRVAVSLGLAWKDAVAHEFFDPALAQERARGMSHNEDIDHLRATGATSTVTSVPVSSDDLLDALRKAAQEPDEFDRYSGPRAAARRRAGWAAVPQDVDTAVEYTRTHRVASSRNPVPQRYQSVECRDLMGLYEHLRRLESRPGSIVLPDALSWVSADELPVVLRMIHEHLPPDGLVVIGLSRADRDTAALMRRACPTVEDVRTAAVEAGYVVLSTSGDARFQVLRLLAVGSTPSLLRQLLEQGTATARVPEPPPRDRGRKQLFGSRVPRQDGAQIDSDEWRRRYERLRGRRSVRLALKLTTLARPLFRTVRRVRKARAR